MLTRRILPPEEWARLKGTELENAVPLLSPGDTRILVVEEDGRIVGCWALWRVAHLEGAWIAPESRGRSVVARELMIGMQALAAELHVTRAVTGNVPGNEQVAKLLAHLRAKRLPFDHYVVTLGGK